MGQQLLFLLTSSLEMAAPEFSETFGKTNKQTNPNKTHPKKVKTKPPPLEKDKTKPTKTKQTKKKPQNKPEK